jgi:hypothetical protein
MKLKDLAKKPELIKITLDDKEIIEQYGEPLDFYTWDRQPMDVFLKIASSENRDMSVIAEAMKDLILDEEGIAVMKDGFVLPSKVLIATFTKLVGELGK